MKSIALFLVCLAFTGVTFAKDQASSTSKFILRKNLSDDNAVVISPERQSVGIAFSGKSPLLLIVPHNFPYTVGVEYEPRDFDLAWITISNHAGFIDCVIISKSKAISFAPPDVIALLKKNEEEGKKTMSDFFKPLGMKINHQD